MTPEGNATNDEILAQWRHRRGNPALTLSTAVALSGAAVRPPVQDGQSTQDARRGR